MKLFLLVLVFLPAPQDPMDRLRKAASLPLTDSRPSWFISVQQYALSRGIDIYGPAGLEPLLR